MLKKLFILGVFIIGLATLAAEKVSWEETMSHSVEFFHQHAWDEESGSYASEIDFEGNQKSDTRYLLALSRMIYALAHTPSADGLNLQRAERSAEFLLTNMVKKDHIGFYFLSGVNALGEDVKNQEVLVVNEQAYGLTGLIALYSKNQDAQLLNTIRELYASFYKRFHDEQFRGFFDGYNLKSQQVVRTKSYNSTVYIATSFLFSLHEVDIFHRGDYERTLRELADLVTQYFIDTKTGWIVENFDQFWNPDWRSWQKQGEYTIGIVGHNFQAAWLLLRAVQLNDSHIQNKNYKEMAKHILNSMLNNGSIDKERGGVFDAFKREDSQPMWHTNKAWWQQAEAILALTLAEKMNIIQSLEYKQVKEQAIHFYIQYFIDRKNGGEFAVVDRNGTAVSGEMKGHKGKSAYHAVELGRFMLLYR